MSNLYEITFSLPKGGCAGVSKDQVENSSEQGAKDLIRARYGRDVIIISGRQLRFGNVNDHRDDRRW